jgi:hypothetical protein
MNPLDRAAAIMDGLRACFCARLDELGAPVCSCTLIRGVQALPDSCGCSGDACGRAWVRLDRIYPSNSFPIQDNTPENCTKAYAAVIELGVLRCVPTLGPQGRLPTAVEDTQAALDALRDADAMLHTFQCCETIQGLPAVAGLYLPRDAGDCGGGSWTITLQLGPARVRSRTQQGSSG